MRHYLIIVTSVLILISCKQSGDENNSSEIQSSDSVESKKTGIRIIEKDTTNLKDDESKKARVQNSVEREKELIIDLVRRVYKWNQADTPGKDMEPVPNDENTAYIGIDSAKHEHRLNEFKNTGFFSSDFISNYDRIVMTINNKIQKNELEWLVGYYPPFGNDADPWCNCQDYPEDNPWDNIQFKFDTLKNNEATLSWTWGKSNWSQDFNYRLKVKKIDVDWKISYLQGFDFNEFIHEE